MSILSKETKIDVEKSENLPDMTRLQAIKAGFLTNVLNPKATLFFLGLFTFMIKPETPLSVIVILALIMIFTAIIWFTIVAIFFTQKRVQNAFNRFGKYFNRFFGGLLILLGIKIALSR